MNIRRLFTPTRSVIALIGAASLMIMSSCGEQSVSPQGSATNGGTTLAKGAEVNALPRSGKVTSAVAPAKAVFGMIWLNTAENRTYIFDGIQWVPHDKSVDDFYAAKDAQAKNAPKIVALVQDDVCVDGDPACTPTGAHGKHGGFDCKVCHNVGGRLAFARTGANALAYGVGFPAPAFDAATKTCSNVACHGVRAGTFSYYFPGNEMDADGYPIAELKTVNYGGTLAASTPSWYATGASCAACHGNPPLNGSDGSNVWHRNHANGQNIGPTPANACELCHNIPTNVNSPIAISVNGVATSIQAANAGFHANGTVNVNARFRSQCFGCH